ncbi:NIF3-like protein 1 isoform X3 [Trichoplusia ni]|uniref:NIF3-like protein 1 n=1 Tax=Trichoplusia ni TaxID=7111 RepID=A0A7E5WQ80_TRINI|nr:NIF3-like protein 1 isoform X3 [Trichoplusia ni]
MISMKENSRNCCVCGSSTSKDPTLTLHRFPKPGPKNAQRSHLMIFTIRKYFLNQNNFKRYISSAKIKMSTGDNIGVTLKKVTTVLENFAPKKLSESWDNTGLLVEPYTARNITKVLLTNDLTEDVALEAHNLGCEMIVSYHPPIFAPMKSVVQSSWKERIVSYLLENRISLYSPHTSWDCVRGGVNDWLASAFSFTESVPLIPGSDPQFGAGRLLQLTSEISLSTAISKVQELIEIPHVRFALGRGKQMSSNIKTVALCAGSGSSVLKGAVADLYLTGEMLHHDVLDAAQKGISVILTNHSDSERGFLKVFSNNFQNLLNNEVQVFVSKLDKDPLVTV